MIYNSILILGLLQWIQPAMTGPLIKIKTSLSVYLYYDLLFKVPGP